jgi:uncharacterized coiled-coil DUF342 family protein
MENKSNQVIVHADKKANGLFWKSMLTGAAVGGGVSLFSRAVRKSMASTMRNTKDKTVNMAVKVKNEPRETAQRLQNQLNELKRIVTEATVEAKDVTKKLDQLKVNSVNTYATMVEVGDEFGDVTNKIKQVKNIKQIQATTPALIQEPKKY